MDHGFTGEAGLFHRPHATRRAHQGPSALERAWLQRQEEERRIALGQQRLLGWLADQAPPAPRHDQELLHLTGREAFCTLTLVLA